ncbi:MAG: NAD(P)H-dependent oxidoreductase [Gloeomargarita sp. SKYG116]|nr:NAD(P)H-dependent oxidoreductase [Gloeomargarita sp. SKYG116]MCS7226235.1 NAD(P)H-dependent oxidoreductase [Gloeomargarita sp. SKYB31]MDW8401820.1 NADPH-dependent FMN reductase [Gloeomargarita sp. SKYGB_i_bin116]
MMGKVVLPVILGTVRQGRFSEGVARWIVSQLETHYPDVVTELIDIRTLPIRTDDAGPAIKYPPFAAKVQAADGLILVVPEYNHGYPGMLKHVLDSNYPEYRFKAVGLCGVSVGGFGGTRVIEALIPVVRAYGLCMTPIDLNFSYVDRLFDEQGQFLAADEYQPRLTRFMNELLWLARTLQWGRTTIPLPS